MYNAGKKKLLRTLLLLAVAFVIYAVDNLFGFFSQHDFKSSTDDETDETDEMYVHFIDVGQGDSTLIETPSGKFILIDAGTNDSEYELLSYLDAERVKSIECMLLTHQHEDHIGSADAVLDNYEVKNVVTNGKTDDCTNCKRLEQSVKASKAECNTETFVAKEGDVYEVDRVRITVLSDGKEYEDFNDSSLCLKVEFGQNAIVFTGDAGKTVEKKIIQSGKNVNAEILKCGHHGSDTSNSEAFLEAVDPDVAVISCGLDNSYGHPDEKVLEILEEENVKYYRTDLNSDVVFACSGNKIRCVNG